MYKISLYLISVPVLMTAIVAQGQYPTGCASVSSRANSNGQATSCPNASGTPYASNFVGTTYASVPVASKTGNLQLKYSGATTSLKPYAITKVWQTNPTTTVLSVPFGPAAPPAVSGSDIVVDYCFYGSNLPSVGTLSLELTNPETGAVWSICSYDASCISNCAVVANPPALLPVVFSGFSAREKNGSVELSWTCDQEINNKGFYTERSINGSDFSNINFTPTRSSQGNSSAPVTYHFTDANLPATAVVWYRIKQADLDGKFIYSAVVPVDLHIAKQSVSIYGSSNVINIVFSGSNLQTHYTVAVYDMQGRMLHKKTVGALTPYSVTGLKGNSSYYVAVTRRDGEEKYTRVVYLY